MNTLKQKATLSASPIVILIRPQLGENIGAVARAMLNFGLTDLRIVCPRDGWPNQSAVAVASGAGIVLENAKIFNSSQDACADINFIFATTARNRDLSNEIFSPKNSMKKCLELIKSGQRVGIMFGPERSGLHNDDISLAQAIISIPTNPKFSSLNLSQCAVLLAYQWLNINTGFTQNASNQGANEIKYAPLHEVEHLRLALMKNLTAVNYFWPEDKKDSLTENLTNLLGRLALTSADVRTLHGVIKALVRNQTSD